MVFRRFGQIPWPEEKEEGIRKERGGEGQHCVNHLERETLKGARHGKGSWLRYILIRGEDGTSSLI